MARGVLTFPVVTKLTTKCDVCLHLSPSASSELITDPKQQQRGKPMALREWTKSNADYGRKLFNFGIEGARSGREAFLNGESLTPFLSESVRNALKPAALGACIGVLGSYPGYRQKSICRALAYGLLGGAIGLGAGFAWESRRLTASAGGSALRNISRVRDEHWLTKHPIDYA